MTQKGKFHESQCRYIVSLFISYFMSELLYDSEALAGMTPGQRALLRTVCRTAARDALELSAPVSGATGAAAEVSGGVRGLPSGMRLGKPLCLLTEMTDRGSSFGQVEPDSNRKLMDDETDTAQNRK